MKILRKGPPKSKEVFLVTCEHCESLLLIEKDEVKVRETRDVCGPYYTFTCSSCNSDNIDRKQYNQKQGQLFVSLDSNSAFVYYLFNEFITR